MPPARACAPACRGRACAASRKRNCRPLGHGLELTRTPGGILLIHLGRFTGMLSATSFPAGLRGHAPAPCTRALPGRPGRLRGSRTSAHAARTRSERLPRRVDAPSSTAGAPKVRQAGARDASRPPGVPERVCGSCSLAATIGPARATGIAGVKHRSRGDASSGTASPILYPIHAGASLPAGPAVASCRTLVRRNRRHIQDDRRRDHARAVKTRMNLETGGDPRKTTCMACRLLTQVLLPAPSRAEEGGHRGGGMQWAAVKLSRRATHASALRCSA